MMTQDTVKVVIGGAGVAASTAVEHIPIDQLEGGMGILTQIVILVATLIGLFKKKKKPQVEEKAEGEWIDSNLIRVSQTGRLFRYPGWQLRAPTTKVIGVARDIHAWKELEDKPHYAVGSNEKVQIEQLNSIYDVTPVEALVTGNNIISTTAASDQVALVYAAHTRDVGDWIVFESVQFPVGGVDFNSRQGKVVEVVDANTLVLEVGVVAASTEVNGGGDTDLAFLLPSGRQSTGVSYGPIVTGKQIGRAHV